MGETKSIHCRVEEKDLQCGQASSSCHIHSNDTTKQAHINKSSYSSWRSDRERKGKHTEEYL